MNKMKKLILLPIISLISINNLSYSETEVYKYRKSDGTIVLTDTPKKGAEEVEYTPNTWSSPSSERSDVKQILEESQNLNLDTNKNQNQDSKNKPEPNKQTEINKPENLTILSPENDAYVRNGNGELLVKTNIEPKEDESLKVSIDGSPSNELYQESGFMLKNIDRGEHNLIVYLVNKSTGAIISTSNPVKFYMYRNIIRQNKPNQNSLTN